MAYLIPVLYRKRRYPPEVTPEVEEVPAHFDSKIIRTTMKYSLHTDYSFEKRRFSSPACEGLLSLREAVDHRGVPKLWFNENWASDFVKFILKYVGNWEPPQIIEIHPPYSDYKDLSGFIELYSKFEDEMLSNFPETSILIENRYGSHYSKRGSKFVVSTADDLNELAKLIFSNNLKLRIALDVPQLFSAHGLTARTFFSKNKISNCLEKLRPIRHYILSIHLYGWRKRPHLGTLDSYLIGFESKVKEYFLNMLYSLFNDSIKRYFVPEVNSSSSDLQSIVRDLITAGFKFISHKEIL